jgi:hypothetical protein
VKLISMQSSRSRLQVSKLSKYICGITVQEANSTYGSCFRKKNGCILKIKNLSTPCLGTEEHDFGNRSRNEACLAEGWSFDFYFTVDTCFHPFFFFTRRTSGTKTSMSNKDCRDITQLCAVSFCGSIRMGELSDLFSDRDHAHPPP